MSERRRAAGSSHRVSFAIRGRAGSGVRGLCLLGLLATIAVPALASEALHVTGSSRVETGVEEDTEATRVDAWFETWARYGRWEASARLRVHQVTGDPDDSSLEEIDRRHLAFVLPELDVLAGNYYVTLGNGIVLRTLEQRFVTLNRVERAFNLDRNLDGVRVRAVTDRIRLTALSGRPRVQELSGSSGTATLAPEDLLQGGEVVVSPPGGLEAGGTYVRYQTPAASDPDLREQEDLVSGWARATWRELSGSFEYAEKRHRPATPRGIARYGRLGGAFGPVGVSLEGKSYRHFAFPYNELPSLVRTQESVLLNRATHVLLPDDERGFQAEVFYAAGLTTNFLLNLSASEGSEASPDRDFREVYLEGRGEIGRGAGRLGLDWARDLTKFPAVVDRWTAALELEAFLTAEDSAILDLELQPVETRLGEHTNQLLQLSYARAGRLSVAVTLEHTSDPLAVRADHASANLDLRLSGHHDLTLWAGSRPSGIVCSGGFCFFSEAFQGLEARLLSRF